MKQTKLESLLEAGANISVGFFISWGVWVFVVSPVWHLPTTQSMGFLITCVFTVTSITRMYIMRRFFNAGLHKACRDLARRITR